MNEDVLLTGGNTSVVVRVGDTVRRPVGAWTTAVHRLLHHLEQAGFAGAPRVLGIDDHHREILEYVDGEVGTLSPDAPLAPWFRTPEACHRVGSWIRDFHCAQKGFEPRADEPWRMAPGRALGDGEVIVHHDVSPYNTVRRPDGSIVVIDWDFARPGDPIEEIAWTAWHWAPLMAGTRWRAEYGIGPDEDVQAHQRRNLAALLDGYRPSHEQRARLADAVEEQMVRHADDLERLSLTDPAFASLVQRDYAVAARQDAQWWAAHGHRLLG